MNHGEVCGGGERGFAPFDPCWSPASQCDQAQGQWYLLTCQTLIDWHSSLPSWKCSYADTLTIELTQCVGRSCCNNQRGRVGGGVTLSSRTHTHTLTHTHLQVAWSGGMIWVSSHWMITNIIIIRVFLEFCDIYIFLKYFNVFLRLNLSE